MNQITVRNVYMICFRFLSVSPGMTTLITEFKSGCGCFGCGVGKAEQLTTHHPASHARQAVRPHVTTLDPEAVFGTQADVFYGKCVCSLGFSNSPFQ